jgi:hypothetical protein
VIKRWATVLLEIVGTLVAGLAIAGGILAWRVSLGPVSLGFLTPYIEQALDSPGHGVKVKLERTILIWTGWPHPISLHVLGVHVLDSGDHPLATLPEIAIGFSVRALAEGILAPTSLEVFGGHVRLRRGAEGMLDLQLSDQTLAQGAPDVVPLLIDDMLQHSDPGRPLSYLQEIAITDADLVIEDSHWDTSWKARLNHLAFERDPEGIQASASLTLTVAGVESHVTAAGLYDAAARNASLGVSFEQLEPAAFTHLAPELAPLGRVALPLSGKIEAKFVAGRLLDRVDFEVSGGAGHVTLPELYDHDVAIRHLDAKGEVGDGGATLALDHATLELGAPDSSGDDRAGPLITVSGNAHGLGGDAKASLAVTGRDIPVDELPARWPASLAPHARTWIVHNLSGGMVEEVHANLDLSGQGVDLTNVALDKLSGTMRVRGTDVHYLGKMPSVKGVDGDIQFDQKTMTIALKSGSVEGLTVDQGTVAITGLDVKDQAIDIELVIRGPLQGVLGLIDRPPLGYASSLGFDPKSASGETASRIKFEFPLIKDLALAKVKIAVAANLEKVSLAHVFLGHDLDNGMLKLRLTKEGMSVAGTATLESTPVELAWDESFESGRASGGPPTRRIEVKATVDDALQAKLGLIPAGIVQGPVPTHLVLTQGGRLGRAAQVALDLDLTGATLAPPRLVWQKKPGVAANAHMILDLKAEKLAAIRDLRIDGTGIAVHGDVAFDDLGALRAASLNALDFGRNHATGTLTRGPDGAYKVDVSGDAFDAAGFLKGGKNENSTERGPRIAIALNLGKLWLSESSKMAFLDAKGSLDDDGLHIARAAISAKTPSGAAVDFQIASAPSGRTLNFASADAGQTVNVLGVLDSMVGGKLKVSGTFDDTKPVAPLSGTFRIDDYRLNNAPFMAKLLTLTSLTGIMSQLSGRGIAFSSMQGSFAKTDGLVKIVDGRTAGSELGLTFEGALDLDANMMDVNGTVVPVYTLNSLLGNIPLLGNILVGPKGGGVFAATFRATGSLDNPDVSVNPLSALAPGILRRLLDVFSSGADAAPSTPALAPAPAPTPSTPMDPAPSVPAQAPSSPAAPTSQNMPKPGTAPTQGGK